MGRLRDYFDQLAHPMQDVHSGRITRAYGSATYERIALRILLSHRSAGGRWCRKAPKGGKPPEVADHRNAYLPYDTESKSRNADFNNLRRSCHHNPQPVRAVAP